jgi:hypothetical protein
VVCVPKNQLSKNVLDLIQWIDDKQTNKKTKIILKNEILRGETRNYVIAFLALYFVVWFGSYEYGLSLLFKGQFSLDAVLILMSILLSALAVVIAGMTFLQPYLKEHEINVRYTRALDLRKKEMETSETKVKLQNFTDEEKPLLKALIEILSTNREFTLKQLCDLDKNKTIFSDDRLLERLCK